MRKSTHTAEYATLRKRLVSLRTAADLSQRGLASLLRVPHSWVAKVESGERRIDLVEFAWYCEACGVAPCDAACEVLGLVSNRVERGSPRRSGK